MDKRVTGSVARKAGRFAAVGLAVVGTTIGIGLGSTAASADQGGTGPAHAAAPSCVLSPDPNPTIQPPLGPPNADSFPSNILFLKYSVTGTVTITSMHENITVPKTEFDAYLNFGQQSNNIEGDLFFGDNGVVPSTFLAFGFEPTSADAVIHENGSQVGTYLGGICMTNHVLIHLQNVHVNGQSTLDVGPACQAPAALLLNKDISLSPGTTNVFNNVPVNVQSFSGCQLAQPNGVENIDPLFDGLVGGDNNTATINLTLLCTVSGKEVQPPGASCGQHVPPLP